MTSTDAARLYFSPYRISLPDNTPPLTIRPLPSTSGR